MRGRHLDVTAHTTLDHADGRAEGDGWTAEAVAVLDVESPPDDATVVLGLELDPGALDHLPHHADYVALGPAQARALAADLEAAARAAEDGEGMTSARG